MAKLLVWHLTGVKTAGVPGENSIREPPEYKSEISQFV